MKGRVVIVSMIVAMDRRRGIGIDNRLPWRLPADLKRFRELTMGHHLIAGRKTWESIGRPLPGRQMIVVTRDKTYQAAGCLIAHSIDEAIALAAARGESEVFIIGGAELYAQAFNRTDRLCLTEVHAEVEADTFFPKFDATAWTDRDAIHHEADEKNQFAFTFKMLERKRAR